MVNQETNKGGRGKSIIVAQGLEDTITAEILSGLGTRAIAARHGLSRGAVRDFATKVKSPPKAKPPSEPHLANPPATVRALTINPSIERNRDLVELTSEVARLKLGKLLDECESNYNRALQEGNQQLAGSWAKEWGTAIDRLLRATGVYERATREAQTAINAEPVVITVIAECPSCKAQHPEGSP
jgi:hypothetical protein